MATPLLKMKLTPRMMKHIMNWYRPLRKAGVKVVSIAPDWRQAKVELRLRWYNQNMFGTHFGGTLYAMTDPFYVLLLTQLMGDRYHIWDQSASIRFVSPGRGVVSATFEITDAELELIANSVEQGDKFHHTFSTEILNADGAVVAEVQKQVYVRLKPRHRPEENEASPLISDQLLL
jgi:hypothetical protein